MKKEDGTIEFDQEEQALVDKIVEERINRVKKEKPEDYEDLKAIEAELEALGFKGSITEKKAAIKQQREAIESQRELDELKKIAEDDGISPAMAKKIKELEKTIEEITSERQAKKAEDEKLSKKQQADKEAKEMWDKQVEEFEKTFPDVDLKELSENTKFMKFVKGKGLPLKELYEDFVEFIGEAEAETIAKVKSKESRSTSSGKSTAGGSHGLNKDQLSELNNWNARYPQYAMSPKEFAEKQGIS